ncbi:MAG TPA: peroxide stress protein YaaA [Planctomycetota bacterium]|nr:peroxide stress protein YaaA [Planctomycetota bacterium]
MLILLSPTKKLGTEHPAGLPCTGPSFKKEANRLVRGLRQLSSAQLGSLMNLSDSLEKLTYDRLQSWSPNPKIGQAVPSLFAYQGEVFSKMNPADFSESEFDFSQKHLRIVSGLYGLLRPLDSIMPYRLEMGLPWSCGKGNSLYEFWGERIANAVNSQLACQGDDIVVNLASNEYIKAVQPNKIAGQILTPIFKEKKGEKFRVVSFCAKRARGLMSRFIIKNKAKVPEELKGFREDGYRFQPKLSSEKDWVFTRPTP